MTLVTRFLVCIREVAPLLTVYARIADKEMRPYSEEAMTQLEQATDRRSTGGAEDTSLDASREPAVYPEMQDLAALFERPGLSLAISVRYEPGERRESPVEVERRGHGYLVSVGPEGASKTYSISPHGEISELADGTFVKRFDWEAVKELAGAIAPAREAVSAGAERLEWRNAAGHPVRA